MPVDVTTETVIHRPVAEVAAFAADPSNATKWYVNIKEATWKSEPPLRVGSKVAFAAQFAGKRLEYTYDFTEVVPNERLVMRAAEGPFPMETVYTWKAEGERATRMSLRNHGQPTGFSRLMAPLLAMAMRRANRKDLARLKALLEGASQPVAGQGATRMEPAPTEHA
jgi:hypothetical protein